MLGHLLVLLSAAVSVPAPPRPVGRLIDVGERLVHLDCRGKGKPTVLLLPGAGGFSFDWSVVQSRIASTSRVCSFDRAGFAWSEAPAGPVSATTVIADLANALRVAGEKGPFVVVGHSYGAVYGRLFERAHPRDVAGMVLVDPSHEDMLLSVGRMGSKTLKVVQPRRSMFDGPDATVDGCDCDAAAADPNLPAPFEGRDFPPEVQSLRRWAQSKPDFMQWDFQYREAMRTDLDELYRDRLQNKQPLGDRPLIVIVAGSVDPADDERLTPCQMVMLRRQRSVLAIDLLRLSSDAELVMATGSSHDVHVDRPEIIVKAVERVRRRAR